MPEVQLSCGESVTVTSKCDPCEAVLLNSDGLDPQELFTVTDGMRCPSVGLKKDHSDEFPAISMSASYTGQTDDGFQCIVVGSTFPDIKVQVRPDRSGGTPVAMPEDFTVLDFRGDNFYIHLDSVLAAFTAAQLKAAMTPAMRTALGAILP